MARDDDERERRAARRGAWAGRVIRLEDEGRDDRLRDTTPAERLGMMWRLALDAWASSGRPLPDYERSEVPGRMVRGDHE